MKTTVEVKDRREAAAVQAAMQDTEIKTYVVIMGLLMGLPSDRSRKRVLDFVQDGYAEQVELAVGGSTASVTRAGRAIDE